MNIPSSIDKYQIIGPLGSGHFGQVFHAFDRALQAEKAIKVLEVTNPRHFLEQLEEAQILNRCVHKHIVAINEANIFPVEKEQRVVLDLEYIPEGSLEDAMKKRWISVRESITYTRGALAGLDHAHGQGILHRDIKPGNILLSTNATKLSDFGLATEIQPGQIGSAQGYKTHLAPEYFLTKNTTVHTDLFATGITLYRAICNLSDWRAIMRTIRNRQNVMERGAIIKRIGYPDYIPTSIKRIINKACNPDPHKRYQSAMEFAQKLDALRFNIDWYQDNDYRWFGSDGSKNYEAEAHSSKNSLVVKQNGRRIASNSAKFPSASAALAAMHKYIAETTLK